MHKNRAGAIRPRHDLIICVFASTPTIDREPYSLNTARLRRDKLAMVASNGSDMGVARCCDPCVLIDNWRPTGSAGGSPKSGMAYRTELTAARKTGSCVWLSQITSRKG